MLSSEQSRSAFRNEFDFDSPDAIDFDVLVERLRDIKQGCVLSLEAAPLTCRSKVAEIPVYSFEKHARVEKTTTIYSPHVLILEGIFALHDARVLELLDLKVHRSMRPHCADAADLRRGGWGPVPVSKT